MCSWDKHLKVTVRDIDCEFDLEFVTADGSVKMFMSCFNDCIKFYVLFTLKLKTKINTWLDYTYFSELFVKLKSLWTVLAGNNWLWHLSIRSAWYVCTIFLFEGSTSCQEEDITRRFKNTIVHENYNSSNFDHDIALLELATPVDYSDSIKPICLEPEVFIKDEFFQKPLVAGRIAGCGKYKQLRKQTTSAETLQV